MTFIMDRHKTETSLSLSPNPFSTCQSDEETDEEKKEKICLSNPQQDAFLPF